MKYSLLLLLNLFLHQVLLCQHSMISGRVVSLDNFPLSGISVYLEDNQRGTITDHEGNFIIQGLESGQYKLIVSGVGFATWTGGIELADSIALVLEIVLKESIATLSEITVITKGIDGIKDIPGSVQYLDPRTLRRFSYSDVNRAVGLVAGVNIQEEEGFGLRPNIGLRGTGTERSSKISLMEDGVLMAPAPYAAPAAYYFPTMGRMQGIEILKGSSQIKYGPYTTGGAVNFISTPIPDDFVARVHFFSSRFGTRTVHTYVGDQNEHFGFLVEHFRYGSDGFKVLDGGGDTGFGKSDFLVKLRLRSSPEAKLFQSLSFKFGVAKEDANMSYLGLTDADFSASPFRRYAASQLDNIRSTQRQISLTHRMRISEGFNWTTVVYHNVFSRNWYKLDKVFDDQGAVKLSGLLDNPGRYPGAYALLTGASDSPEDRLMLKANNRAYQAGGVQTNVGYKFSTGSVAHDISMGLRFHSDRIDRFQWVDNYGIEDGVMKLMEPGIPGTESNRIDRVDALAAFVSYRLKVASLSLTPGLRFESMDYLRSDYGTNDPERTAKEIKYRTNEVSVFIPGVGIDYKFSRYTGVFGGIHKGFAPPGSREGTVAESSINYELGFRHRKGSLALQTVLFLNDYDNLLGTDLAASGGGGSADLFNGGELLAKGLELEFGVDLLSFRKAVKMRLPISLAYTYTSARFKNAFDSEFDAWGEVSVNDELPYLSPHQLAVQLGVEYGDFMLHLNARYRDRMRTRPGQAPSVSSQLIESYSLVDFSLSYQLAPQYGLFASVQNLTDRVYAVARRPAGLRPGMPRSFRIGIRADW